MKIFLNYYHKAISVEPAGSSEERVSGSFGLAEAALESSSRERAAKSSSIEVSLEQAEDCSSAMATLCTDSSEATLQDKEYRQPATTLEWPEQRPREADWSCFLNLQFSS